jgi:hypothetical protein
MLLVIITALLAFAILLAAHFRCGLSVKTVNAKLPKPSDDEYGLKALVEPQDPVIEYASSSYSLLVG